MPRTVPVTMPAMVWGRLASIADNQGITVADVIADAVAVRIGAEMPAVNRLRDLEDELRAARRSGWRVPRRDRTGAREGEEEKTA